jgi:hypothetical protein
MTTSETTRKTETPATTRIPAYQKPVIGGNYGLEDVYLSLVDEDREVAG